MKKVSRIVLTLIFLTAAAFLVRQPGPDAQSGRLQPADQGPTIERVLYWTPACGRDALEMPVEPALWQAEQYPIELKASQPVIEANSEVTVLTDSDPFIVSEERLSPADGGPMPVELQAPHLVRIGESSQIPSSPISVIATTPTPVETAVTDTVAGWIYTLFKLEPSPNQPAEPIIPSV